MLKNINTFTIHAAIKRFKKCNINTRLAALGSMALLLALLLALFLKPSEKLVLIDMHEAMSKPAVALSQSQYSQAEQGKIMQLYSRNLKLVLKEYGKKHQKTIIESRILSDANHLDITDEIVRLTMEKVKHG